MKKFIIYFSLLAIIIAGGCHGDDYFDNRLEDATFLSLPTDTDFSSLDEDDWTIIKKALSRISLKDGDDRVEIYPQTAADANMSENLYGFIKSAVDNYNSDLKRGIVLTRSGFMSNGENNIYGPSDCVAHAVAGALPGVSYQEANSWLTREYGNNGVPAGEIYHALSHFGSVTQIDPYHYSGPTDGAIAITGGHAVNVMYISGDYVLCRDRQKEAMGQSGACIYPISSVTIFRYN